jgi:putative cardiolipin synthase
LTSWLRLVVLVFVLLAAGACTTSKIAPYVELPQSFALPASPDGPFVTIESEIPAEHGAAASGFRLLDTNEDGLRWRLALIDEASQSIDAQYYLWYGDAAGRLLAKRLVDAADRGVKVRMLVDDLNTLFSTAGTVSLRDRTAALLDFHPNIEVRLFNPWSRRSLGGRIGEGISNLSRLHQRMHNKALIVDNRAVILGGRNIGDEYMGLNAAFNFHDLDVLGIGPVARQASAVFDSYWNSEWVMPAAALDISINDEEWITARAALLKRLDETESLARFPTAPQSWSAELEALPNTWHLGTSQVRADLPTPDGLDQRMLEHIQALLGSSQHELLIVNAYIIPAERGIETLRRLHQRGVDLKILTNSLASHDVPAVNSHYKEWRKPIIEAGAELFEMRHDAAIQPLVADTAPTKAGFMGLHSKAMVVDRERVYIGSMNYDPRSALFNTEMGVFVESRGLGEALAKLMERDMHPENSWQLELDEAGALRWANDEEVVTSQPARNWWQRVEDVIFKVVPKEYY